MRNILSDRRGAIEHDDLFDYREFPSVSLATKYFDMITETPIFQLLG
jgi:hypothetical protein